MDDMHHAAQSDKYTTGATLQNQVMLVKQDPANIVGAQRMHPRAGVMGAGIFKPTVVFTEAIGKLMSTDDEHFRIGERCALRLFIDNFVLHAYLDRIREDIKAGVRVSGLGTRPRRHTCDRRCPRRTIRPSTTSATWPTRARCSPFALFLH